jgi:HEAT repeat protein/TolA-binding protein
MNRITLSIMLVAAVSVVGAQTPPTPPVRPAPSAAPAPTPRPTPAEPYFRLYRPDLEEMRGHVMDAARRAREIDHEAIRAHSAEAASMARELNHDLFRVNAEAVREQSAHIAEMAREASRAAIDARAHGDFFRYTPMAPMEITPMPSLAPMQPFPAMRHFADEFQVPRPSFQQGEPADSMYRLAHDILNRGDYGRAAAMFKEIAQKYPNSVYQNDLPYYEAFSRYKVGTTTELQTAAKLLEPRASKLIGVVSTQTGATSFNPGFGRTRIGEAGVAALYVRINKVLASRGDNGAASIVAKAAQAGPSCDPEEMSIKSEAMGAMSQMDPAAALPIMRTVLDKKDDCTVELRRTAVRMLGRRGDAEAGTLLASAAKSDPSIDVRIEAINWLPRVQGDAGVNMLEELLRTDTEDRIQRSIVRALNSSDNQRARTSMRGLIGRKDAPTTLRVEAVNAFNNERATADDAAYLRNLYGSVDNDRVKEAIINAIGRIGGTENDQWILTLARNQNESSQFRAAAIARLMGKPNITIAELGRLYDASESYDIRTRIVSALERRSESESADKLVDIARNSTVINIRMQALKALQNRKDARAAQLLQEFLDGKRP